MGHPVGKHVMENWKIFGLGCFTHAHHARARFTQPSPQVFIKSVNLINRQSETNRALSRPRTKKMTKKKKKRTRDEIPAMRRLGSEVLDVREEIQ